MADSFDDGKFWLPPQFLNDDDDNTLFYNNFTASGLRPTTFRFPSSDFSSPVESVIGSTETESDEEDVIFGLTRQLAHSTVEDGFKRSEHAFSSENPKEVILSGSPQSTLCALQSGCGCKQDSSRGSPNCQSRPAPPSTTWDLLHAAAGEVARMRMNEEMLGFSQSTNLFGPPKPSPISVPKHTDCSTGFYPHQSLSHQKLQAIRYQQIKNQQQILKQQIQREQMKPRGVQYNNQVENRGRFSGGQLSPVTWPSLQQAKQNQHVNGSGMRAIFLGDPAAKRQSAGTGVFLPRRVGAATPDTRKKTACSTVLVPARVVQALNMNLGEIGTELHQFPSRVNESYTPVNDARLRMRNNNFVSQQRNLRQQTQPGINGEILLPSEWTY